MNQLTTEKFPGVNGEDFEIRIVDQHTHIETSIDLVFFDNGEERKVNIQRYSDGNSLSVKDLLEKAKGKIELITILRRMV